MDIFSPKVDEGSVCIYEQNFRKRFYFELPVRLDLVIGQTLMNTQRVRKCGMDSSVWGEGPGAGLVVSTVTNSVP